MVKTLELYSPQVNQIDNEVRPNKMHEIVGKEREVRAVRRGRPLIPYLVASRSEAVVVEAVLTSTACFKKSVMISEWKRMGLISRIYTREVITVERNIMSDNP